MHASMHEVPVVVGIVGVSRHITWIVLVVVVGGGGGQVNNVGVVFILVVVIAVSRRRRHLALEEGRWLV